MSSTGTKQPNLALPLAVCSGMVVAYFGAVLALNTTVSGFTFSPAAWYVATMTTILVAWVLGRRWHAAGRFQGEGPVGAMIATLTTVLLLLVADVIFAFFHPIGVQAVSSREAAQETDPNILIGQLYPRLYYPTPANFQLFKPSISISAEHFGNFYHSDMLKSETLSKKVLEKTRVDIRISASGFRDDADIADAEVFALGDSLTFGWRVNLEDAWVKQVEGKLQRPTYNLGVYDASPHQEVELLTHVLETIGRPAHLQHVIWMIYEGNDLHGNFNERAPALVAPKPSRTKGTLLELLLLLPGTLQKQAILHRLVSGEIVVGEGEDASRYVVDGVRTTYPLYTSETLGPVLFFPAFISRAQDDEASVLGHPNWPKLLVSFDRMAELSRRHHFEVTVVLVPTAVRLHGPHFTGFPTLSKKAHLLDHLEQAAIDRKFEVLNMLDELESIADSELLYFRDDDHLNLRGNTVIAERIAKQILANGEKR